MLTHPGFEYGYPDTALMPWYGLWNPNCDCFIWVHHDLERIKLLQMLCSSKAMMCILELDAELYKKNVIDNQCCMKWTVKDLDFSFNEIYKNYRRIPRCQLISKDQVDAQASRLQAWLLFVNHWLMQCERSHNRFDHFLTQTLGLSRSEFPITDIYKVLLLAQNQDQAQQQINMIIDSYV